jgi:hypothetical protein
MIIGISIATVAATRIYIHSYKKLYSTAMPLNRRSSSRDIHIVRIGKKQFSNQVILIVSLFIATIILTVIFFCADHVLLVLLSSLSWFCTLATLLSIQPIKKYHFYKKYLHD